MTTGEVLRKARALLVDRGWCQGDYRDKQGRHCAVGAIDEFYCVDGGGIDESAIVAIDGLHMAIGSNMGITTWNDAPGRALGEVLAAFDRAIAAEEAKS